MVNIEGVEICIRYNGQTLTEYEDPEQQHSQSSLHQARYIEAVPGEKFSISVSLTPQFRSYGSNGVSMVLQVENHQAGRFDIGRYFSRTSLEMDGEEYLCPNNIGI